MGAITNTPLLRRVMQVGAISETQYRKMLPDDPRLVAYAAGYFDGEGCITLCHDKRGYAGLKVAVVSLDRHSVNLLAYCLGGRIGSERHKWKGKSDLYHRWSVTGKSAQGVLIKLIPFLVGKRPRAIKACELDFSSRGGKKLSASEKSRRTEFAKQGKSWRQQ